MEVQHLLIFEVTNELAPIDYPLISEEASLQPPTDFVQYIDVLQNQWAKDRDIVECHACKVKFSLVKLKVTRT
jgi:hypothetical protein